MKLAIAITMSALLTGCAAESDDFQPKTSFPDDIEILVIAPGDSGEVDVPNQFTRPGLPADSYDLIAPDREDSHHKLLGHPRRDIFPSGPALIADADSDSGRLQPRFSPDGPARLDSPSDDDSAHRILEDRGSLNIPEELAEADPNVEDPCNCEGTECLEQWIADQLGCDVCVTFVCGDDDMAGACNMC